MKRTLILSLFVAMFSGCSTMKSNNNTNAVSLNGKLEKLGMTTFQYGSHLLTAEGKTYALKSSTLNLDTYVDKQVSIKGEKVAGYPVENGPELIDVKEIKAQ